MIEGGWIKLHRRFREWEWYRTPHMVQFFIHCLLSATHAETSWQGITLKPGQFIAGRKSISEQTGISEQITRNCIKRLKSTNELTIKSTNKFSIITITNWDTYQQLFCDINQQTNQQVNQQSTNNQPTINHIQECKEQKKKEYIGDKPQFIKPTFEEIQTYCAERKNGVDPKLWMDHYTANGWKVGKNKMVDWKAAVRTWEKDSTPPSTAGRFLP